MTVLIHYEIEQEPKIYTISASSEAEFKKAINSFKERTNLSDNQIKIEIVSAL